ATATLDKYKAAATVVSSVLQKLIEKAAEGANVLELCQEGDKLVEEGVKGLYNKVKGTPKGTSIPHPRSCAPPGIAFPTTVSVNNTIQNFSPVPSDKEAAELALKKDDLVKIVVGAHIDGYPVVSGETYVAVSPSQVSCDIVVGASSPITGARADLIQAAYQAGEIALRAVKPGVRNWEVTDAIKALLKDYEASGVKGVEGILSHQVSERCAKSMACQPSALTRSRWRCATSPATCAHEHAFRLQFTQNNLEAKKGLVSTPTASQRSDSDNAYVFEEGEVYGLNIHVTNGDKTVRPFLSSFPVSQLTSSPFQPKTADLARTTIFSKTPTTYMLKMKTSRATFSEISQKAGSFPFTLRIMEDETRARMACRCGRALTACFCLKLVPFNSTTDKPTDLSAQIFLTFAVTKTGATRISLPPSFYSADKVQSEVAVSDAVKQTLAKPLKAKAQKKKAAKAE
ncbi:SPOSA6832_03645, partial [Sporobolomyces salmonicolor]